MKDLRSRLAMTPEEQLQDIELAMDNLIGDIGIIQGKEDQFKYLAICRGHHIEVMESYNPYSDPCDP